jgi:hypothetical protein
MTPSEWAVLETITANGGALITRARERAKEKSMEEARIQALITGEEPRIDPLTGDALKSDELPLSPTAAYHLPGEPVPAVFCPRAVPSGKTQNRWEQAVERRSRKTRKPSGSFRAS